MQEPAQVEPQWISTWWDGSSSSSTTLHYTSSRSSTRGAHTHWQHAGPWIRRRRRRRRRWWRREWANSLRVMMIKLNESGIQSWGVSVIWKIDYSNNTAPKLDTIYLAKRRRLDTGCSFRQTRFRNRYSSIEYHSTAESNNGQPIEMPSRIHTDKVLHFWLADSLDYYSQRTYSTIAK